MSAKRRVAITGLGAVTPLGVGASALHERWAAGVCAIKDRAGRALDYLGKDGHRDLLDKLKKLAAQDNKNARAFSAWLQTYTNLKP